MKKILIISDTHGILRDEVRAEIAASDYVIHAGDIDTHAVLSELKEKNNLYIVRGNNDYFCGYDLPQNLAVEIEGVRFFIVHRKDDAPKNLRETDVVIYGHSHKYSAKTIDNKLWLNPGSCGKSRFGLELTMCRMCVDNGNYEFEKVVIE